MSFSINTHILFIFNQSTHIHTRTHTHTHMFYYNSVIHIFLAASVECYHQQASVLGIVCPLIALNCVNTISIVDMTVCLCCIALIISINQQLSIVLLLFLLTYILLPIELLSLLLSLRWSAKQINMLGDIVIINTAVNYDMNICDNISRSVVVMLVVTIYDWVPIIYANFLHSTWSIIQILILNTVY